jgi:hypothetical protein
MLTTSALVAPQRPGFFVKNGAVAGEARTELSVPEQQALGHAWSWFALHAGQRLQLLNFFLVSVAFLTAAYVAAFNDHPAVSGVVGVAGAVVSFAFRRLELRTRELVHIGEAPLAVLEARLAALTDIDSLRMLENAEAPRRKLTKYSLLIRVVQWTAVVAFCVAGGLAFAR